LQRRYGDKLEGEAAEFIKYIVDGSTRMQKLIEDLLAYSRVGSRGKALNSIDATEVLHDALANLEILIEEASAKVTHEQLPTIAADRTQLMQLFQNLVGNAIKFRGSEPPEVHIRAARKGREWVFSVRDNGIGIDPKHAERVFVIFQRLHDAEQYPGTGIGLSLCKRIVERHGGRIWVESEVGKGCAFKFTIPVAREGPG
jgi:light-regulated signal transduction histidine kinase (bacteriophytochrome)